ncbi:MAG: TerB family tellurite resistance protein [Pseudomonadales bacterium]|nr:TerB family tellurite resistance protein [Pseudomonadales bacterium]
MFLASLTQAQQQAFFCLAHNVVVSDGELSVGEEIMMEAMRREMNLTASFKPHYLDTNGIGAIFDTNRACTIAMISLIRLGYADGAFEVEERCFLQELCSVFKISEEDFARIDNWVRRLLALEKEAKDFL